MTPEQIANTYNLRRRGNRWAGPCPKCGGSRASDKFVLRDDGGYKCYGCDFRGDAITWHREMEGMSCPEAHEAAGQDCRAHACPVYGTCRLGDGSGKPRAKSALSLAPAASKTSSERTTAQRDPAEIWRQWANHLWMTAARELEQQDETLDWLLKRGIDATIRTGIEWGLGWHTRSQNVDRASIGLPPEKDGKTTLWVPAGIQVPPDLLKRLEVASDPLAEGVSLAREAVFWARQFCQGVHLMTFGREDLIPAILAD